MQWRFYLDNIICIWRAASSTEGGCGSSALMQHLKVCSQLQHDLEYGKYRVVPAPECNCCAHGGLLTVATRRLGSKVLSISTPTSSSQRYVQVGASMDPHAYDRLFEARHMHLVKRPLMSTTHTIKQTPTRRKVNMLRGPVADTRHIGCMLLSAPMHALHDSTFRMRILTTQRMSSQDGTSSVPASHA